MKRVLGILITSLLAGSLFAAGLSYKNNTYQKLADEYAQKAERAMDAGQYDAAVEYSQKATENAELSKAYIAMMMARSDADDNMAVARTKVAWAESIDAQNTFPMAYSAAKEKQRQIDKRIQFIESVIENCDIIDVDAPDQDLGDMPEIEELTLF